MANHTPGPWLVISGSPPCVRGTEGANVANDVPFLEDARLIAAAPDLLAALENIANYTALVAGDSAERLSAMVAARAAIRKAKGE